MGIRNYLNERKRAATPNKNQQKQKDHQATQPTNIFNTNTTPRRRKHSQARKHKQTRHRR